jgi:hypothetical protein
MTQTPRPKTADHQFVGHTVSGKQVRSILSSTGFSLAASCRKIAENNFVLGSFSQLAYQDFRWKVEIIAGKRWHASCNSESRSLRR